MSLEAQVRELLSGLRAPYLECELGTIKAVREVAVADGHVRVTLVLGYPVGDWGAEWSAALRERIASVSGVHSAEVELRSEVRAHAVQPGTTPLQGVRNVIAVASGKGGVGKSTTAVNMALALQQDGARVGILDADIYGPSQPRMLGCSGRPEAPDDKTILPLVSHRLQNMSIGYLVDEDAPMIWRGPMATSALQQLLTQTRWQDLDYLIVDLPPGTGDIQLTLAQKIPVSGAVIVTTPQDISLLDARRSLKMFEKVKISVLGIIENMSVYVCPKCGHEEQIFGAGGGQRMAAQYEVELLGCLPLDKSIREGVDNGKPTMVAEPDGEVARAYLETARRAAAGLALLANDYSAVFPKIVVEQSE